MIAVAHQQLSLDDAPRARATDPSTSHEAARRVKAGTDKAAVLRVHHNHPGGLTDFELADRMGRAQTSVGVRRGSLVRDGLVVATETRRATPSGAMAIVWRITPDGVDVARQLQEAQP